MADGNVAASVVGPVVTLMIDRAHRANALTPALCEELRARVEQSSADPAARVLVLRGAGGRAFCGGFDLDHVGPGVDDTPLRHLIDAVRAAPLPIVGVLDGAAIGAGFELACACDVRVAQSGVPVGVPAVRLGVPYSLDGITAMVRAHPGAVRLLLTGQTLRVDEVPGFAVVCPADELNTTLGEITTALAEASPAAIAYTRRAVAWARGVGRDDRGALEALAAELLAGPDLREAVDARRAGRAPEFTRD